MEGMEMYQRYWILTAMNLLLMTANSQLTKLGGEKEKSCESLCYTKMRICKG